MGFGLRGGGHDSLQEGGLRIRCVASLSTMFVCIGTVTLLTFLLLFIF